MNDEQLRAAVISALARIAPESDPAHVPPDADLREALDIDSMDFYSFVLSLHESLKVDIPERDYPKFFTLAGCVRELKQRLGPA